MLKQFRENVYNEQFWNGNTYPYVGDGMMRYYADKFLIRLDSLIKEKGIKSSKEYNFSKSLAIKKFREACIRYYDISSYTKRDEEDCGNHLMVVAECYEWIAIQLGIPAEKLQVIRFESDELCVRRLFEEE